MQARKLINSILQLIQNIEDEKSCIPVPFYARKWNQRAKFLPKNRNSTCLQELSATINTYFGVIRYENHLDMKIDYTISRNFQQRSLSDLGTLHHLCELERAQIKQSLALAVLKIPYAGQLLSGNRSSFVDYKENIYSQALKNSHHYMCLKIKDARQTHFTTKPFLGYRCPLWITR